ncbi:hypothetical protein MHYP_G00275810 [Metynnis hypsauchen]
MFSLVVCIWGKRKTVEIIIIIIIFFCHTITLACLQLYTACQSHCCTESTPSPNNIWLTAVPWSESDHKWSGGRRISYAATGELQSYKNLYRSSRFRAKEWPFCGLSFDDFTKLTVLHDL